jgi:hypothetical protein
VNDSGRHRRLSFRMPREVWLTRRRNDIEIAGLGPCLALFGLEGDGAVAD